MCHTNLGGGESGSFCKDDTVMGICALGQYEEGDCGAYGGTCSDSGGEAHCVHFMCWSNLDGAEDGSFCVDDTKIGNCNQGEYNEGDCAAFGGLCSETGGATHCVHFTCWSNLDGAENGSFCLDENTVVHCALGMPAEEACAAGSRCSGSAGAAACSSSEGDPDNDSPPANPNPGEATDENPSESPDDGPPSDVGETGTGPAGTPGGEGGQGEVQAQGQEEIHIHIPPPKERGWGCATAPDASGTGPMIFVFTFLVAPWFRRKRWWNH
jgi:hypothetical protein